MNDTDTTAAETVDQVLARVGDDPNVAADAIDQEQKADKPRTTLLAKLQTVVDASDQDPTRGVKMSHPVTGVTVTAHKPSTITRLKSEGFRVHEDGGESPRVSWRLG